ncbi:MAG: phosphoribosylformylglycinamidine cyclo-ligase [Halanaerobiales bacterium]|nr:phosphoribosylformylglycinamidine cyclo-ligase [Halanaerobiales bacterium]
MGLSYKDTGVDIDKGKKAVEEIKDIAMSTYNPNVITELGSFGGLFNLDLKNYENPVLAAAADGVGTKLKLAFLSGMHKTIGIDLVAMNVNDLITLGAKPLFFLDYIATGKLSIKQYKDIIVGIAEGCRESSCALLGGETAEMPDFYKNNEYDIAGFCVGLVDKNKIIDGSEIKPGDRIIGLGSNGIHSNGYSLVRKIFINQNTEIDEKLMNILMKPTKIYVDSILPLLDKYEIKGLAHITGGGVVENIPRILPEGLTAEIDINSFNTPDIFTKIKENGKVAKDEMYKTFNMGIGMVLIVKKENTQSIINELKRFDEKPYEIGVVTKNKQRIILRG